MEVLGYERYAAQGGDWGHLIAAYMSIQDPHHCLGLHLNMVAIYEPKSWHIKLRIMWDIIFQKWRMTSEEREWWKEVEKMEESGMGYVMIQGTKPNTI